MVLLVLSLLKSKHLLKNLVAHGMCIIVVIVTVLQLVSGILGLLVLLIRVRSLNRSVIANPLSMISILNAVLKLNVLSVLGKQEHILGEYVDDCENVKYEEYGSQ